MGIPGRVTGRSGRRTRRFLLAGSRLPAGAVLAGLVLLAAGAPAGAQTLTWSVVLSPSPSAHVNRLDGVSCVSATACTAAGDSVGLPGGAIATLIESWNGASWSVVPSPSRGIDSSLASVSCPSATACTAAGEYTTMRSDAGKTLIESWNGTNWSVVFSPNRGTDSFLASVSCLSGTACTATGGHAPLRGTHGLTLIESGTASG